MSRKQLYWAGVLGGGLIISFLTLVLIKHVFAGIIGGVVGAVVASYLFRGFIREEVVAAVQATQPETKGADLESIFQGLLNLNIKARTTSGISLDVITALEGVIDFLQKLVPAMNDRYSGEELTWETCRMANFHLPRLVQAYFGLPEKERAEKQGEFLGSLKAMQSELEDIQKLLASDMTGEFSRKASAIQMKYGK